MKNLFSSIDSINGKYPFPELPFGKRLDDTQFLKLTEEALNYAYTSQSKDLLNYKNDILKKIELYTQNIFTFPNILKDIKKNGLLNLIMAQSFDEVDESKSLIKIQICTLTPLIKLEFNKDNNKIDLDKKELKQILTSNVLLDFYKDNLGEFIVNYSGKIKDNVILAKYIESYLNNFNIYFCDLPSNIMGITIFTGNIYLRSFYLKEYFEDRNADIKNPDDSIIIREKIILNLMHEINHALLRIIDEEKGKNFFIKSKNNNKSKGTILKFKDKNIKNKEHEFPKDESGNCFDYQFFKGYYFNNLFIHEANFFLDIKKIEDKEKYIQEFDKIISDTKQYRKTVDSINKFKKSEEELPRCFNALIFRQNSE